MNGFKDVPPTDLADQLTSLAASGAHLGSEAVLRSILPGVIEEFADGVAMARVLEGNSPLVYVNAAFERLTGYGRHEALGKDCRYLQGSERDAVLKLAAEGPPGEEVGLAPFAMPELVGSGVAGASSDGPVSLPMPTFGGRA